jgi:hypothetical protein
MSRGRIPILVLLEDRKAVTFLVGVAVRGQNTLDFTLYIVPSVTTGLF